MISPEKFYRRTILPACGQQTLRSGGCEGDLKDECFEGQQAALKYSRRFDISTPPAALCRAPATKPPDTDDGVEQSPQDPFSRLVSMQDQYQTSSREYCEPKSNNNYASEKGLWKSNVSLRSEE